METVVFKNGMRNNELRVTILNGTVEDHDLIEFDGVKYQRNISARNGSTYQCDKCDLSKRLDVVYFYNIINIFIHYYGFLCLQFFNLEKCCEYLFLILLVIPI